MSGSATQQRSVSLFRNPEFVALSSVRFVSGMAFATIIIALALYADVFEASGTMAGLFGSAFAVVRVALVLPLGRKIDLGNSKRYLLVGLCLNVALFIGLMLVESLAHVIVLRGFQAIGWMILWLTSVAAIGEIAPEGDRGFWIGTTNQVRSIASLSGDLVGGGLLFVYGFTTTYAVLIVLTLISMVLAVLFLRDDPGSRADSDEATGVEALVRLLKRRAVLALVVFRFTFSLGKMAVYLFLPIYARTQFGMNAFLIGGILAGGKLTKGLTQGYTGKLSDRIGRKEWFIFVAAVTDAVGAVLIPTAVFASTVLDPVTLAGAGYEITLVPAFFLLFVAYGISGIADSLRNPTSMALFVQEGEYFNSVAGSLSLRSVAWGAGAVIGPVTVGALFDRFSYFEGFWVAAGLMLAAGVVFLALYEPQGTPEIATDLGSEE